MNLQSLERLLADPASRERGLQLLETSGLRRGATLAAEHLQDRNPFVRNQALECLKLLGNRKYARLVARRLGDRDGIVRVTALECLVEYRAAREWRRVAQRLSDKKALVRAYAAWALGRLGARQARARLKRRFTTEKDGAARAGIAEALFRLEGDTKWLQVLLGALLSRRYEARCFGANSLVGLRLSATWRQRVRAELKSALRREKTVGGRDCLRKVLREIGG